MKAELVSQSSDKTVIRERVPFGDVDGEPVVISLVASVLASTLGVAMPLNVVAHLDMVTSFVSAGGVTALITGGVFAFNYAGEVYSDANRYSTKKYSFFKTLTSVLLPFGQKIDAGSGKTRLSNGKRDFDSLVSYPSASVVEATHQVNTKVKFTPLGAYIEQELVAEPLNVWDDAFKSTLSVHKFRETSSAKKQQGIRL